MPAKGQRQSEETRKLMVAHSGRRGKAPWNKGLKGLKPWNKGLKGGICLLSEETKEKMREYHKNHKTKPPSWLGKHHTEETKNKISKFHKGKKLEEKCGKEKANEIRQIMKMRWTPERRIKQAKAVTERNIKMQWTPELRQKLSKTLAGRKGKPCSEKTKKIMSENLKKRRAFMISPLKDTSIEVKVQKELTRRGIAFKKHYPVAGYNIDIFIESCQTIIEVNGCYWHSCLLCKKAENKQKIMYDKIKLNCLDSKGYKVFVLWEHEIRKESLLQKRLEEINQYITAS